MGIELKSYDAAKEYFTRAMHTCDISEIILIHNQRDTVRKLIKETSEAGKRIYIEKDLSTMTPDELGGIKTGDRIPDWLKPAMKANEERRFTIFLREFHAASGSVKDDVLNLLIRKCVKSFCLPKHTLIVVGVLEQDEAAEAVGHTHTVRFMK